MFVEADLSYHQITQGCTGPWDALFFFIRVRCESSALCNWGSLKSSVLGVHLFVYLINERYTNTVHLGDIYFLRQ